MCRLYTCITHVILHMSYMLEYLFPPGQRRLSDIFDKSPDIFEDLQNNFTLKCIRSCLLRCQNFQHVIKLCLLNNIPAYTCTLFQHHDDSSKQASTGSENLEKVGNLILILSYDMWSMARLSF